MLEIIGKPWGWEFTLLQTGSVLASYLHIKKGFSTSLHCHPKKRTGYVVLEGDVEVEFLSDVRIFSSGDRVNFRPGLFHKTRATNQDCIVLELESPPNKEDLLRLEDSSGRTESMYEKNDAMISGELLQTYKSLLSKLDGNAQNDLFARIGKLAISRVKTNLNTLLNSESQDTIICLLDGVIFANEKYLSQEPGVIVNAGDVTSIGVLQRMRNILSLDGEFDFLMIKKL